MDRMNRWFQMAAVVLVIGSGTRARADLALYVEAAGDQFSNATGMTVTTETFDGFTPGNYSALSTAVGPLATSGAFAVQPADVFGGAGGTGNYFALGAESGSFAPVTLTLSTPQAYFGFWWSAADTNNQVSFYSGATLLGSFSSATALGALDYAGSPYLGNPNGGDPSQVFAYLNVVGTSGTTISSIVIANNNTTSSGFEADNFSISSSVPTGGLGTEIVGGIAVPEPSTFVVALVGALGMIGCSQLRRMARN